MPAIGVSSGFQALVAAPSGCVINEVTQEQSRETKTIKNASGITVQAGVTKMIETKISVKGKGNAAFGLTANPSINSGTVVVTEISVDESQDDFPDFSITAMKWSNT